MADLRARAVEAASSAAKEVNDREAALQSLREKRDALVVKAHLAYGEDATAPKTAKAVGLSTSHVRLILKLAGVAASPGREAGRG